MDPNDKNPSVDDFDNDEYWSVFQTLVGGQSGGFCVVLLVKIVKTKKYGNSFGVLCVFKPVLRLPVWGRGVFGGDRVGELHWESGPALSALRQRAP